MQILQPIQIEVRLVAITIDNFRLPFFANTPFKKQIAIRIIIEKQTFFFKNRLETFSLFNFDYLKLDLTCDLTIQCIL